MFDVYAVFYFSFLRKEDKKLYNSIMNTIYSHHELSDEVKTRTGAHQKKLTKTGKKEKIELSRKFEKKTRLYMSIYSSALQ